MFYLLLSTSDCLKIGQSLSQNPGRIIMLPIGMATPKLRLMPCCRGVGKAAPLRLGRYLPMGRGIDTKQQAVLSNVKSIFQMDPNGTFTNPLSKMSWQAMDEGRLWRLGLFFGPSKPFNLPTCHLEKQSCVRHVKQSLETRVSMFLSIWVRLKLGWCAWKKGIPPFKQQFGNIMNKQSLWGVVPWFFPHSFPIVFPQFPTTLA